MLQEDFISAYTSLATTPIERQRFESFAKRLTENPKIWNVLTNAYHSERLDSVFGNLDRHRVFAEVLHVNLIQRTLKENHNATQ